MYGPGKTVHEIAAQLGNSSTLQTTLRDGQVLESSAEV